jgi:hypothetical protein
MNGRLERIGLIGGDCGMLSKRPLADGETFRSNNNFLDP